MSSEPLIPHPSSFILPENPLRSGLRLGRAPEPCTMVIFGATGDLTSRKLVPALYNLARERRAAPAASAWWASPAATGATTSFRETAARGRRATTRAAAPPSTALWGSFAEGVSYLQASFDEADGYASAAASASTRSTGERGTGGNRLFYLATPPESYPAIIQQLGAAGLAHSRPTAAGRGSSSRSPSATTSRARDELNAAGARGLRRGPDLPHRPLPRQGDGAEHAGASASPTASSSRSGTGSYIDHVQITVAETVGRRGARRLLREGRRAARHGPEPPAAAAAPDRDGAAGAPSTPTPCATRR